MDTLPIKFKHFKRLYLLKFWEFFRIFETHSLRNEIFGKKHQTERRSCPSTALNRATLEVGVRWSRDSDKLRCLKRKLFVAFTKPFSEKAVKFKPRYLDEYIIAESFVVLAAKRLVLSINVSS